MQTQHTSDHPQTPDPPSRQLGVSEAAAGPSPEGSMRSWEAPAARGGTLGARRRSGSRRPSQPVSLVLGGARMYGDHDAAPVFHLTSGAACAPQKSLPALPLLTPVLFFGPILRPLHGAAELTRRLLHAKLRAAPSRIDEPQFPPLPLELPRDPRPRCVHPSSTCELAF